MGPVRQRAMSDTIPNMEASVNRSTVLLAIAFLVAPPLAEAAPKKGDVKEIVGSVWGFSEGDEEPLVSARIEIRPLEPLKGKDRRPASDLVGVAVTDVEGNFTIPELSSVKEQRSFPLMPSWKYLAKVVAPGHYVFNMVIDYRGEGDPWDFMLEAKVTDVVDDSGTVTPGERALQRGATRRGSQ